MPHLTPPLPLDRPSAYRDPNTADGPSMPLQQALATSAASCAFRRMERDHEHAYARAILVQCKLPRDWWVYEYRLADGVFTGWPMGDELEVERYLDARLHTPRDHGWWPASGLLDVQALSGVSLPDTPQ